jgi:hypothetical protein
MDVLVNTPTHTWAYTGADGISREELDRLIAIVSPNQEGSCLIWMKNVKSWVTKKLLAETTSKTIENETVGKCGVKATCIIKISSRSQESKSKTLPIKYCMTLPKRWICCWRQAQGKLAYLVVMMSGLVSHLHKGKGYVKCKQNAMQGGLHDNC